MGEPINLRADPGLRRLLEHPAPSWRRRRSLSGTRATRATAAAADAAQIVLIGLGLRPLFPVAEETFSFVQSLGLALFAAVLAVAARNALRPPGRPGLEHTNAVAARGALAAFLGIMLVGAICWIAHPEFVATDPTGCAAWFLAWAMGSSLTAAGLRHASARIAEHLESGSRVVVVGPPECAGPVGRLLQAAPRAHWRFVGSVDDREPGALDALVETVRGRGADVVVLALTGPDAAARITAIFEQLADQPVRVSLALDAGALAGVPRRAAARGVAFLPLVDVADDPHGGLGGLTKRCMDIGFGSLALILAAPAMLLAALAIKLESPGPVFFQQRRFGLGSQPITVLKFRTMRTEERDATGERRTLARDPRVTRVGRFLRRTSIDELPQLINVLRGDMSLVGPRPHPLHMRVGDAYYFEAVAQYRARHLVRPGITGWAQVNGSRGAVDTLEKARRRVDLDLFYLENWSIWLDMRILLTTALGGFVSLHAD